MGEFFFVICRVRYKRYFHIVRTCKRKRFNYALISFASHTQVFSVDMNMNM